jgi:SAM-dependent methyltransferase
MEPADTWELGDRYERYIGRWSRLVAAEFLAWLDFAPGHRWLDVGCGTGALAAAVLGRAAPSALTAVEPSAGFLATASERLGDRARLLRGDASAIPLDDAAVDVVVSGLMLNFVPDPRAALTEMKRVTSASGTIAAYVWDYAGKMDLLTFFWEAAVELFPEAAKLDERVRFPLCEKARLAELFAASSLARVEVTAIAVPTLFASFDDYWGPFLGGQGPAPAFVMSLAAPARQRLRDRLRERLPAHHDGSLALSARALAVRGTVTR